MCIEKKIPLSREDHYSFRKEKLLFEISSFVKDNLPLFPKERKGERKRPALQTGHDLIRRSSSR